MATLLSHSPRRFLRLLRPETLLPRTLFPTMTSPCPPHTPAGNSPPGFGPSGWSSAPPQWHRALCRYASDPRSSSGISDAGLAVLSGVASPDVVEVSADEGAGATPNLAQKGNFETSLDRKTVKIMTYYVWSERNVELSSRMNAVGDLIQQHTPDLICLQEVTPQIYPLLKNSDWWGEYECSLSCERALERPKYCMQMSKLPVDSFVCHPVEGRELCIADVSIGGVTMVLATSHLKNPYTGHGGEMYIDKRVAQEKTSLRILGQPRNVIFCGDMNWNEEVDGPFLCRTAGLTPGPS